MGEWVGEGPEKQEEMMAVLMTKQSGAVSAISVLRFGGTLNGEILLPPWILQPHCKNIVLVEFVSRT